MIRNNAYYEMTKEEISNTRTLEEVVDRLKTLAEELAPLKPRRKHQWWTEECDKQSY